VRSRFHAGVPDEALPLDRNRASGGIGLGLSIARRAIELHKAASEPKTRSPGWK
jgi:signal transduction histidine kinase